MPSYTYIVLATPGPGVYIVGAGKTVVAAQVFAAGGGSQRAGASHFNGGGGGGAFSYASFAPIPAGTHCPFQVGAGGSGATQAAPYNNGTGGQCSWFNGTWTNYTAPALASCAAEGGGRITSGEGGRAGIGVGTIKFSGGGAGTGFASGGGGGAGPNGAGGNGAGSSPVGYYGTGGGGGGGCSGGSNGGYGTHPNGGAGGNNHAGAGGGAGGITGSRAGNAGTAGGAGGGTYNQATSSAAGDAGAGSGSTDAWGSVYGSGGGGGGVRGGWGNGGNGGGWGGGGGACGSTPSTLVGGNGAHGGIVLKVTVPVPPPPMVHGAGPWLMERMDNRIWQSVEDAYAVDSGVSNPMVSPAAALSAVTSGGIAVFTANAPVFSTASIGQVIRMGGGIATVTGYADGSHVSGSWSLLASNWTSVDPYAPAGEWTIASPITAIRAPHLAGRTNLVGLLDGVPISGLSAVGQFGDIVLPFPASNVKVGLGFTAQMQTAYLNGAQVVQGARKVIPSATVRVAASARFEVGTNQPDGGAQNPQQLAPTWSSATPGGLLSTFDPQNPTGGQTAPAVWTSPGGQPVQGLFTGDLRGITGGSSWVSKGQVAVQMTLPMALEVTAIEPEYLPGDAPEAQVQPRGGQQGGADQGPQQPRPPGPHMLRGAPRI